MQISHIQKWVYNNAIYLIFTDFDIVWHCDFQTEGLRKKTVVLYFLNDQLKNIWRKFGQALSRFDQVRP